MIGPGNVISGNRDGGIAILGYDARGNRICANSIFDNIKLGIDLNDDDVTKNDLSDPDVGPNLLMNFPDNITASSNYYKPPPGPGPITTLFSSTTTTVSGRIDTPNPSSVLIKVFFNDQERREGKTYAGCTYPKSDGTWSLSVPGYAAYVTATATDAGGNTSEFSAATPVYVLYGGIGVYSGNETWVIGSKQTIRWGSSGFTGPVKIEQGCVRPLSPGVVDQSMFMSVIQWFLLQCDPCGRPSWLIAPIQFEWVTLFESTPNDGEKQITVTGTPAPISVLRISSVEKPEFWAISENIALGQPDFVVTGLPIFPLIAARGNITIVPFTILNQGSAPAGPTNHKIWLVTPPDFGITRPDILLGTVNTGTLAPGASASFLQMVLIPGNTYPGNYLIRIVADAANAVSESNEMNNTAQIPITITSGGPF